MSDLLQRRLQRLLFLIPYVGRHHAEGVTLMQAVEAAGYRDTAELEADLPLVQLLGPPDGTPEELVDVYIEDDRIFVYVPKSFTKPPRFSVVEGVALLSAAQLLLPTADGALAQAVSRLRRALPVESDREFSELSRAIALQAPPRSPWHAALEKAISQQLEVTLDYYSPVRACVAPRRVEPRTLFARLGYWYLEATSEDGKRKPYRLDRVQGVTPGERHFAADGACDDRRFERRVLFFDEEAHPEVVIRFDKALSGLAHELWGEQVRDEPDGSVTVTLRMASEAYAISWVLGFGGAARILSPAEWQDGVARRAGELLARHEAPPASGRPAEAADVAEPRT